MNITEAFNKAKITGQHVRRRIWSEGTHIQLKSYSIRVRNGRGKSYTATLEDLLSSDWEFYSEHLAKISELEHGESFTVPDISHHLHKNGLMTKIDYTGCESTTFFEYCIDSDLRLYRVHGSTLVIKA